MKSAEIEKLRNRLIALLVRLQPDVMALAAETRSPSGGQAGGALTNAPMHLGDMGTEEFLHDLSTTLLENEARMVREANEALERIDDGTYGTCESCGKPIPMARLEAIPYVRLCVRCADATPSVAEANMNVGRPRNPIDTLAPEGEMNEDWRRQEVEQPADSNLASTRDRNTRDEHAAGTPGGGAASGGLAGSNEGRGEPNVADLQDAAGSGVHDADEARAENPTTPRSGRSGGAVGGTPANKRAASR
jgi:RNA polymerase-binding transcription factor DksA